jgi:hypothetical protein
MASDIFDFWSRIKRGERIHPDDRPVFARMNPERHGFKLDCLPCCFAGPLLTAPVVLLYLSPGYDRKGGDEADAESEEGKDYYFSRWKGSQPLRDGGPGTVWSKRRTKSFGDYEVVRNKIAILNIGAYHSTKMESYASMLALPSSRVVLDWSQNHLFPEAEKGNRVVICMRSHAYWGLEAGKKYGGTLLSPKTTRDGLLPRTDQDAIIRIAQQRLGMLP